MKINHLSVSRTQVWQECKQKYKYQYHMEMPSLDKEQPYFIYGKAIHKIIEVYTKSKGEKNINEIKKEVISGAIQLEDNKPNEELNKILPESYIKRFKPELESFMKLNNKLGFEGEIEWKFEVDLDPPNKKILYGFIDRLIKKDDNIVLIDYKTTQKNSSFRKDHQTAIYDLQLQCYAKVVMDQFNIDPKKIKVAFFYFDQMEIIGANFSKNTLDNVFKYLVQVYDEIHSADPSTVKGTVGKHCNRCGYSKICPFFNPTQAVFRKKYGV